MRPDVAESTAAHGVQPQAFRRDGGKGLRNGRGDSIPVSIPRWRALREAFDQKHAKRPKVGGGSDSSGGFGRVAGARRQNRKNTPAGRLNAIHGKLNLLADDHDIGRLETAMNKTLPMKPGKRVEKRLEHLANFPRRERSRTKHIGEYLVGAIRHGVEQIAIVHAATPGVE